jgi:hypothetical protein
MGLAVFHCLAGRGGGSSVMHKCASVQAIDGCDDLPFVRLGVHTFYNVMQGGVRASAAMLLVAW